MKIEPLLHLVVMKSAIPTKAAILAVSLTSLCQLGADELTSPNGQYKIEYTEAREHETNVELKNSKTGEVLERTISYGYQPRRTLKIAGEPGLSYC